MGYSHYYYTDSYLKFFPLVKCDFKKMIKPLEHLGVKLADGMGENEAIINDKEIIFNGPRNCGHDKKNLGITWPSKNANGVFRDKVGYGIQQITKSQWFAGAELESRVCGGDCSHETFMLSEQSAERNPNMQNKKGLNFNSTKTAYKPYDLAVNVCLIIAKDHCQDKIQIHSDGTIENWQEAMQLCQHFLGYGRGFELDKSE